MIEDNVINREVRLTMFESLSFDIAIAATGEEALQCSAQTQNDIIFMGIHLPGIDGLETSEYIKQYAPNLPIIGFFVDTFELELFLNSPSEGHTLDDYLTKPVDNHKIINVLNRYFCALN